MSNKLNDLLYSASDKILLEIKSDATENLKGYHDSESVITNKSTSLLQILFPVFIGVFGFIIVEFQNNRTGNLLIFSCLEESIILVSSYFLFDILRLKKIALLGAKPSVNLAEDLVTTSENDNYSHYLRVSIYSLENAISQCDISHNTRKRKLSLSLSILMIGTFLVAFSYVVTLIVTSFCVCCCVS